VMVLGVAGSWIYSNYAPMDAALAMETRFSKPKTDLSSIQIAVHVPAEPPATRRKQYRSPERQQVVALSIPMDVSGLGEGQDLVSDEVHFTITNENGEGWSPKGNRKDYLEHVPNGYRLTPLVDRVVFEKAKGHPVHLSLRLYLTMLGNPVSTVLRPGTGAANVSGVGRCRYFVDDSGNAIVCESPLRATSNLLQVRFGEERWGQFVGGASYSPFPADSSISPLRGFYHSGSPDFAPATLTSLEPLAHFRRDINLTSVNLADYQISASARF
jgi:hypothetical protein